ncbi:hypothetical protein FGO68_gene17456 [Halteria grandinella]|uniref:LITAF domain-containing protein n=1 Tax=Halteria grandinella TaxID=5974 RepID=A0A8J8NHP5_HALGN|nr:hypothetical protein FGO68_gene17456 [Halteria grandinella]
MPEVVPPAKPELIPNIGPYRRTFTCGHCRQRGLSVTTRQCSARQSLCSTGLLYLCVIFFWVPYCYDECYDVTHRCRYCKEIVGIHDGNAATQKILGGTT